MQLLREADTQRRGGSGFKRPQSEQTLIVSLEICVLKEKLKVGASEWSGNRLYRLS